MMDVEQFERDLLSSFTRYLSRLHNPVVKIGELNRDTQTIQLRVSYRDSLNMNDVIQFIYGELAANVNTNNINNGTDRLIGLYKFELTPILYDPNFEPCRGILVRFNYVDKPNKTITPKIEMVVKPKMSRMHLLGVN